MNCVPHLIVRFFLKGFFSEPTQFKSMVIMVIIRFIGKYNLTNKIYINCHHKEIEINRYLTYILHIGTNVDNLNNLEYIMYTFLQ